MIKLHNKQVTSDISNITHQSLLCHLLIDIPWCPVMEEIDKPAFLVNTQAALQCKIYQYFPNDLTVSWYMKKKKMGRLILIEQMPPTAERQGDNTYSCTAILKVTPSIREHDGAEIICRVEHPSLKKYIEKSTRPIQVYVTPELREQKIITVCDKDGMLCSLNLRRFFPKKITITWENGEGKAMASKTFLQVNDEEEEAFDAISECRIPWINLIFPIRVTWQHESMAEQQHLQLQRTEVLGQPILHNIEVSDLTEMNEGELKCHISGYFSDAVTVSWYKKENGAQQRTLLYDNDKYKTSVTEPQRQRDSTYSCTASLHFTPTLIDQGSEIICRVEHPGLETPLERSSGPLCVKKFLKCPILENIEQSVLVEMIEGELLCRISGYFPDDVTVSWYKKEKGVQQRTPLHDNDKYKTSVTESQRQTDSTYSCTASLRFTPTLRDQGSEIICRVNHPSLKTPLERSSRPLCVKNIPWRPFIQDIDTSNLTENDPESVLHCGISGYFPDAVTVSWYKKDNGGQGFVPLHDDDKYTASVTMSQRQPDSTYSCTASLRFTPTPGDQGSEIICRVEHPSLKTPLERSYGPLYVKRS